jgi:hypothetical protein
VVSGQTSFLFVSLLSLSLSDCLVSFSELELEVTDLREGVDEVVAFVRT